MDKRLAPECFEPRRAAIAWGGFRRVFIRNLKLHARIGVHRHERGSAQPIRINVDLAVEDETVREDRLEAVVDYESMTKKVRAVVAEGHFNLAETMAERIAGACLEDDRVRAVRVCVEKLDALPGAESAGVEIERSSRNVR